MEAFVCKWNRDFHCRVCGGRIDPRTEGVLQVDTEGEKGFLSVVKPYHISCFVMLKDKRAIASLPQHTEAEDLSDE